MSKLILISLLKKGYPKIQTGVPHIFVPCRTVQSAFFKSVNARANHSGKCIIDDFCEHFVLGMFILLKIYLKNFLFSLLLI